MYIPEIVWKDIVWGYWCAAGPREVRIAPMRATVDNWVRQYGGPKTGLCLNVLIYAYPGRDDVQYRQIGEGIFAQWDRRGTANTSNGREDMYSQFFWNALLERK
jgi:hypothetical protein